MQIHSVSTQFSIKYGSVSPSHPELEINQLTAIFHHIPEGRHRLRNRGFDYEGGEVLACHFPGTHTEQGRGSWRGICNDAHFIGQRDQLGNLFSDGTESLLAFAKLFAHFPVQPQLFLQFFRALGHQFFKPLFFRFPEIADRLYFQHGLYLGNQLVFVNRFGKKAFGADFEGAHFMGAVFPERGQKYHGNVAKSLIFFQDSAYFKTISVGHENIEQDHVGGMRLRKFDSFRTTGGGLNADPAE
jgi:hypothetical protein